MKEVYQTDHEGFFIGITEADESPLEPGVFLIPSGCVEVQPPTIPKGKAAKWNGSKWVLVKVPAPVIPDTPDVPETPSVEPEPGPEQIEQRFMDEVQMFMDNSARSFGYDDIKSAVTYAEEPSVPKFQNEGKAFRAWRSLVWAYCYEQLDRAKSGDRAQPELDEFILELPQLEIEEAGK